MTAPHHQAPAAPRPSRATPVTLVLLLGALTALAPLSIDAYLPGLPSMASDLSATASAAQLTLTAFLLGLAAGQLIAGPLSDIHGRRPPLLVGMAVYAVASLACALAPTIAVLVGTRFVQGAAGSAGIVIANAVVRDRATGAAATTLYASLMLVNGTAPMLAPVLGAQVLRVTSWRGVFGVLAALGLLLLAASTRLPPAPTRPQARGETGLSGTVSEPTRAVLARLLRDRSFRTYALAGASSGAAMFAYISASPFVLQNLHGLSPQAYSVVFGLNALGLVVAGQVTGRLAPRVGAYRLLLTGTALSAGGGLLLLLDVAGGLGLPLLLAALACVVGGMGFVFPSSLALALADHGDVAGSAAALVGLSRYLLGGLAAPLVGLGGTRTALPMALVIVVLTLGGLAATVAVRRRRELR